MENLEKLLVKKWDNKATAEELQQLAEIWASLSNDEKIACQKLERYWKSEGIDNPEVNQARLWNRIDRFIEKDNESSKKHNHKFLSFFKKQNFGIAASVLILITSTYFYLSAPKVNNTNKAIHNQQVKLLVKETKAGQKSSITLSDGSTVMLNSKSRLIVPERFSGDTREVDLVGEAYFKITPNKEKPFIVNANGAKVRVLGTGFNLNTNSNSNKISLNVVEGKVMFSGSSNETKLFLEANEAATMDLSDNLLKKVDFDSDALAWSKGVLIFNSSSFSKIIERLETWYGADIDVQREIKLPKGFTGRYNNESLENVLTGISFSVDFEFIIQGKKVIIK